MNLSKLTVALVVALLAPASAFAVCINIASGAGGVFRTCDTVATSNGQPVGGTGVLVAAGAGAGFEEGSKGARSDAFDNASLIFVNNAQVVGAGTLAGSSYLIAPSTLGGLTRTLRYDILSTESTARIVLTLRNNTAAPISATLNYVGNFGSDGGTVVNSTFSGDTVFTTADEWIVTSDGVNGDPTNTTVFFGGTQTPSVLPTSVSQVAFSNFGTQGYNVAFNPTIPAGRARTFIFFQRLSDTAAIAVPAAQDFTNIQSNSPLLAGLSASERIQLANFSFGTPPPADNNPRKSGGYIANGAANCRGASPADAAGLVAGQDGLTNTAPGPALVVCNQPADEFARSSGNGTPLAASIESFSAFFTNFGVVAASVTCTGTAGRAAGPQFTSNKMVSVPAGTRASVAWTAAGDNAGTPFQRPNDITCVVPTNVQINETFNRYFREVGDFTPVP